MATTKAKKPTSKKLKAGKKKSVNKWVIAGGVAAVAIVGALVVRFSGASSYAFTRNYSGMSMITIRSGRTAAPSLQRYYGTVYAKFANIDYMIGTLVSKNDVTRSRQICAHYRYFGPVPKNTRIRLTQMPKGQRTQQLRDIAASTNGNICSQPESFLNADSKFVVTTSNGTPLAISSFYGTR